nr:ankyrin repeat protein [Oriental turtle dovepox virus]
MALFNESLSAFMLYLRQLGLKYQLNIVINSKSSSDKQSNIIDTVSNGSFVNIPMSLINSKTKSCNFFFCLAIFLLQNITVSYKYVFYLSNNISLNY